MSADPPLPSPPVAMSDHDRDGHRTGPADLTAAMDAAACLGTWTHDPASDRFEVAPRLGRVLGLSAGEHQSVSRPRILSALDPDDRPRVAAMIDAVRETGAPFELEFGARGFGGTRILRWTGRSEARAVGETPRIRGLAFDLTELRAGRGSPPLQAQWQANQLAGHVIALKGLVAALDSPPLTRLVERMAVETGFALARHLGGDGAARH